MPHHTLEDNLFALAAIFAIVGLFWAVFELVAG